jgi:16S rRNA (guanine966-N2)-methyltransferase
MKILSGKFKHKKINVPSDLTKTTKPSTSYLKLMLVSLLQHNKIISKYTEKSGLKVCDMFSGTGGVGFEIASNMDVSRISFIDVSTNMLSASKKTADELGLEIDTFLCDLSKGMSKVSNLYCDIVYLDPPYDIIGISGIIDRIFRQNIVNNEGIVVLEWGNDKLEDIDPSIECIFSKKAVSKTHLFFFAKKA